MACEVSRYRQCEGMCDVMSGINMQMMMLQMGRDDDNDDTSHAVHDIALCSIARTAEEEEPLDGLLNEHLDFDVALDAVDHFALDPLLLLGGDPHDRVRVGLRGVAPRTRWRRCQHLISDYVRVY